MTVNTLGGDVHDGRAVTAWRRLPLVPLCAAIFALAALVSYHVRADGGEARSALQSLIVGIYRAIGFAPSAMFFVLVIAWSTIWYFTGRLERPVGRLLRLCGMALALAILVNVRADGQLAMPHTGAVGAFLADRLVGVFGYVLSTLLAMGFTVATVLLATDFLFYRFFEGLGLPEPIAARRRRPEEPDAGVEADVTEAFLALARTVPEPARAPTGTARVVPATPATGYAPGGVLATTPAAVAVDVTVGDDVAATEPAAADDAAPADEAPVYRSRRERRWGVRRDEAPAAGDAAEDAVAADEDAPPRGYLSPIVRDEPADELAGDDAETSDADAEDADAEDADADGVADDDAPGAAAGAALDADDTVVAAAEDDDEAADDEEAGADGLDDDDDDDADDADADEIDDAADVRVAASPAATTAGESEVDAGLDEVELEDDEAEQRAVGDLDEVDGEACDEERDEEHARDEAAASDTGTEPVAASTGDAEPVVPIPRPADGVRQQRLFLTVDEALVREAAEIVTATRRASVTHLQRKLRVDYEQAVELLAALARRGVIDWAEGETNGRVR